MIKVMTINGKRVPIPVPLRTLPSAIEWVCNNLVRGDSTLTLIELDGEEVDIDSVLDGDLSNLQLSKSSRLSIKIDTPMTLAIQSLDALRNLASITEPSLKPLAVNLWQVDASCSEFNGELDQLDLDMRLLGDLLGHVSEILDAKLINLSELIASKERLSSMGPAVMVARGNSDWKSVAKILLNKIEPELIIIINIAVATQNELCQLKMANKSAVANSANPESTSAKGLA